MMQSPKPVIETILKSEDAEDQTITILTPALLSDAIKTLHSVLEGESTIKRNSSLVAARTSIITVRSLFVLFTKKGKVPKILHNAASLTGKVKDRGKKKDEAWRAIELLQEYYEKDHTIDYAQGSTVACRIEECRNNVVKALEKKWLDFEIFHDMRNEDFRRLFHLIKSLFHLKDNTGLVALHYLRNLYQDMRSLNRRIGRINDATLDVSQLHEIEGTKIDWGKNKVRISKELRDACCEILNRFRCEAA